MSSTTAAILIIEDTSSVQILLKAALRGLGADLCFASTAEEARDLSQQRAFDLILLDITLPGQDGLEFFNEMQTEELWKSTPVIFLTGNVDVSTKVAAFALGADDYIVKPFNALELRARVEAKLKRAAARAEANHIVRKGDLQLDASTQRAYTLESGEPQAIRLTPREFKLLFHLARNEEHILSRAQLLDAVWGDGSEVYDRTVDTHLSSMRKKLGALARYIESVPGAGYRFSSRNTGGKKAA